MTKREAIASSGDYLWEIFDFGRNCTAVGLLVKVCYIAGKIPCN